MTPKLPFVVAAFVVVAIAALKLTLAPTNDAAARAAYKPSTASEPAIDPSTLTREAPRDLPVENWNPI